MDDLEQRLVRCFATVLPNLESSRLAQATAANTPDWDSTTMVNLQSVVEEEFGIALPMDDAEYLTSYTALRDQIRRQVG